MAGRLEVELEVYKVTIYEVIWHKIKHTQCILLEYRCKIVYCDADIPSIIYKEVQQDTWSCEVVTPGPKLDRLKEFIQISDWKEHKPRENYYTYKKINIIRGFGANVHH